MSRRRWLAALIMVLVLYLGGLPAIWPAPRIDPRWAEVYGLDPEMIILVRSWHSNVRIASVGFCIELSNPNPQGQSIICPEPLFNDGRGTEMIPMWKLSRLTYPRTTELRLRLPLGELVRKGEVPPGLIRGWVAITVIYAGRSYRRLWLFSPHLEDGKMDKLPFEFDIG